MAQTVINKGMLGYPCLSPHIFPTPHDMIQHSEVFESARASPETCASPALCANVVFVLRWVPLSADNYAPHP